MVENPYGASSGLLRNPKFRTAGKIVSLADFLDLAKDSTSLVGVSIKIEVSAMQCLLLSRIWMWVSLDFPFLVAKFLVIQAGTILNLWNYRACVMCCIISIFGI